MDYLNSGTFEYIVNPGTNPIGSICLSSSKHVALRCLVASLLTEDCIEIENFPHNLIDAQSTISILTSLGKEIVRDGQRLIIKGSFDKSRIINNKLHDYPRITTLMLGPLLTRFQNAIVPYPGGCKLGTRPVDLHKMALELLGARIDIDQRHVFASKKMHQLRGNKIVLPIKSNGAAECAILASCLARGTTVIREAHVTPELLNFTEFLKSMGANISIIDSEITVQGVKRLHGTNYTIMPDVVEGITFALLASLTNGNVIIRNFPVREAYPILHKLNYMGVNMNLYGANIEILRPDRMFGAFTITAGAYPRIYSDMQPLLTVFGLKCNGTSILFDERWPNRFTHVDPLNAMGANIKQSKNSISIHGIQELHGAELIANDIRCGMAILMAALLAKGKSIIREAEQIERGYEDILTKLQSLGFQIEKRQSDESMPRPVPFCSNTLQ